MSAVDFEPENYKIIVADPQDNHIYYTEDHLDQMIAHYFARGDVNAVEKKLQAMAVPASNRLRVQMAVVILSQGKLRALNGLISSAEIDYRDVLMELN